MAYTQELLLTIFYPDLAGLIMTYRGYDIEDVLYHACSMGMTDRVRGLFIFGAQGGSICRDAALRNGHIYIVDMVGLLSAQLREPRSNGSNVISKP